MTTDVFSNIGVGTIASRGFIPMAVEAGVTTVIESLISGLAQDQRGLLISLKGALSVSNPPLAAALNTDNLSGIIAYMQLCGAGIIPVSPMPECDLPVLLDESGPASVVAARDGGTDTQVNITFSEYPGGYEYEIYLDGVYQKTGDNAASSGFVNDNLSGVTNDGNDHTIRVLFVNSEGSQTRFGQIATFS